MEAEPIEKTGVYGDYDSIAPYEELVEIEPTNYIERHHWDYNEYNGEELPDEARLVCRYFEGSFVIYSTRSIYNLVSDTYDGRHNQMTESEFRHYINRNASANRNVA
ncbi:hypothetical protein RFH39_14810 [Acinetobacter baumannii]|uniref:hypothetical protein n=1 Tax=Acinetobacter baumannii TaxID=470 RepID=UPI00280C4215|nr:hypothetical protein [Acinetobacter baumannii]MDQ8919319.1 hypothetical protein [Acinetobacter baumannii]MDQ8950272.1 hypothetical protein [Acinetobacter baumannii]MDQ8964645.1 hypothetical protein [Acinetobacter baumannii]MDQ8967983.1 hypothetical protein [Acinetobacter baumannii]MDQ8982133.1 hypothetical protein [Acinetobacter baumannii]